ncbi:lactate utilization protein C (plasmid) [Deinococcus taeanensis]|uniref:LutC/YkgG family protein n=1 Tax=Deinococcus taeanensis TaxID=2737050 RepID=UPI001CDD750F|nr:lactate utilization protein C [Deinococcus taeanensis]UBV44226.1 lactate utilization protein C [Deinococcus taeanensis]
MTTAAKLAILTRINRAAGGEAAPLTRAAVRPSARDRQVIVAQFAAYAADYRANVIPVSAQDLAPAIGACLARTGSERVVVPADLPAGWLPAGPAFVTDQPGVTDLTAAQAVVTGCAAAIAETGTVVLDHGPRQGRRAVTLVPDHHICVVWHDQVLDSLPEAVAHLTASVRAGRPLTWISGPSATSDIELSRVEGVHGPRVLDILLVHDEGPGPA